MLKIFILAFISIFISVSSAFAQVSNTNSSYAHPAGSTFTPATVTPVTPAVNSAKVQQEESSTAAENNAAAQAVTNTNNQVNSVESNPKTQQDLNAKTGTNTTYQSQTTNTQQTAN
jgi:hypothetical protein